MWGWSTSVFYTDLKSVFNNFKGTPISKDHDQQEAYRVATNEIDEENRNDRSTRVTIPLIPCTKDEQPGIEYFSLKVSSFNILINVILKIQMY